MATGVIKDTTLFVNPGQGSVRINVKDVLNVARTVYQKLKTLSIIQLDVLTDQCKSEYASMENFQKSSTPDITSMFRLFLNTKRGTIGRTYSSLSDIELAKVKLIDAKRLQVISMITDEQLEEILSKKFPSKLHHISF